MSQWKRVFVFIILNIIVSAGTTLVVLAAWDRAHPLPAGVTVPTSAVTPQTVATQDSASLTPLPTAQSGSAPITADQANVVIDSVLAPGNLADETVLIKSQSEGSILLTNWQLQDDQGNVFTFPELTLNKNGAVQVHTGAGTNTVIDLYWGREAPVWQQGHTATLLDDKGKPRASYKIP
jgi:hypothetical protein